MKHTIRKALALFMTIALVATTITFTAGNTLQAEEQAPQEVSQETSEPAIDNAPETKSEPEKSEPVTEKETVVLDSDSADDQNADQENTETASADEDLTAEEEENAAKMPAQKFSGKAGNGITVNVSAPEGAFPEGTTMKVTAVSHAKAVAMVEDTVDGIQDAKGVDITFYKDGKEIQPKKNISVKLGNAGVDGDSFSVYHVGDNQSVDKVTDNASAEGASFKAGEFSIYIVVGQEDEQAVPDSLKVKFRFLNSSLGELEAPDTIYVEKNEQGQYVIEYTIPQLEGKTAERVDCYGADFEISSDGIKVTATVDAAEDDSVQQEASCDIIYVSQKAKYTIKHVFEKEGASSDTPENKRYEARADVPDITLEGEIGTETEATAQVINGFTAQEIDQEIISGDAEQPTVVTIKYDRNKYFLTYDTQGGSYVKGKTISYGSSVDVYSKNDSKLTCTKEEHTHSAVPTASANNNQGNTIGCYTSTWSWSSWHYEWVLSCNTEEHSHDSSCYGSAISSPIPSRQGYTFEGWYSDAECTEEAPQTIDSVEGDYTVYAKWTAKNVNYTVVVRKENVDGSYSFVTSSTKTAKTGDTVTASGTSFTNSGYYHLSKTTSAEVKADGSTVVYADYDLNTYILKFDLNKTGAKITMNGESYSGSEYTISCKLGEDISAKWPTAGNISGTSSTFYGWKPSNSSSVFVSKRFEVTEDMIGSQTNGSTTVYTGRWENGTKVILHYMLQNADDDGYTDSEKFYQEAYSSGSFSAKSIYGYKNVKSENKKINGVTNYYFYYDRNTSSITYYFNDTVIDTKTGIRFDKNINTSEYNFTPDRPEGMDSDYTFGGWYDNPGCTGDPYAFNKMPATNMALYAKWIAPEKTITVHFENGSDTEEITVTKGEYVEIQTPSRPGYNFVGWYTAAEGGEAFDINAPVNEDAEIYAHWTKKTKVAYRVEFVTADGTEVAEGYTAEGRPGSKVVADAVTATGEYQGWFPDAVQKTITLDDDSENNVITFRYSDKNDFRYKVIYKYGDQVISEGDEITVHENTVRVAADDVPEGYVISGEQFKTVSLGNDSVTDIVFQLSPRAYTISYKNIQGAEWSGEDGCSHPETYTIEQLASGSITIDGLKNNSDSIFLGWDFTSKNADGTDASITGGHNAVNPVIEDGTYGNLEFTAKWGKITAQDVVVTYDGQLHGIATPSVELPSGVTVNKFMYRTTESGEYSETIPTWKDAGRYTVYVKCIVNGHRNLYTTATVTINKRDVTLTSATDSKEFDGKPLTNHEVTVSGDGFAKGEGATYGVTGSQKIAGSSTNYFTYTLKEGTKADNYNITKNEGTLTVTNRTAKYEITVEANSGSEKYDGTEKSVSGLKTTEFTVNGETYTVSGLTASASGTNAGEYPVNVTGTPAVTDAEGNDVTEQFAVKTENGTLTIAKRNVTLTSESAEKEFDGKPLTNDEVTVSGDGFADGEGAEYTVTGSQKIKGTSANEFSYTLNAGTDAANYEITCVEGQLTVTDRNTKYSIEVEANSGTSKYDGTVKAVSGLKTTEFTVEGEKYTVSGLTAGTTGTDAGEYTANVTGTAVVKDADNNDVTSQFAVTAKAGKLTIAKRDVTLTSGSAEKEFDGDPLTNDKVTVSGDGFAGLEGVNVTVKGSQKYEGSSANRFDYTFKEGTKADNYNINKEEGTLKVTTRSSKYEIKLVPNSSSVVYDSKEHEVSGFETLEFTVNNHKYTVSGLTASTSGTDAGEYPVKVTGTAVVKDADNVDVTSQFSVSVGEGSLEITKAPAKVVIAGNTGVAEYDGTEHTAEGYKVESVVSDNDLYKEDYIKFNGEAKAVRTEEGTKNMGLKTEQFENENKNFNVEFQVKDGWMQITPIDEVVVIITGHNDEVLYDGTMHTLKGYDVQISNKLFAESDIKVSGNSAKASISEVNAGEYSMGLSKDDFSSDNKNFKNVTFRVSDGTLKINKRNITVTSGSASKYYDGKPLRNDNVYVTGDGLADTDELAVAFGEGITEAGKRDNEFNCAVTKKADVAAFKADGTELELDQELQNNYVITKVFGELEVLERSQVIANAADDNNGGNGNPGLVVTDGYNVTTIGDGQTPLAKNLLDLNCCILHLLIMLAAMLVLLWYTHDMKKRQRKIFELEEQLTEME